MLLAGWFYPAGRAAAEPETYSDDVTAYDLIIAMNTLRASFGHPALIEDPTIDAVAQSTAEIMAANEMSSHIGNVSGRLQSAGFGGGGKVMGTENFAAGSGYSIDQIMVVWSDEAHMLPATYAAYCNVGAGIAKSPSGLTYYVLQAAYVSGKSCGGYTSPGGATLQPGGTTGGVSQVVVPVQVAAPDADGNIYHVVQAGQSFWAIAVTYKITIKDIETWNNISRNQKLQIGQKLLIPGPNTKGYATPTPVGMFAVSTPDADGKIVHTVAAYQTLSTIAAAYHISVDQLLALNYLQLDWPLQIGQELIIQPSRVTPSPTPRPLTPLEKLTPGSDGKYYHVVKSGENLSSIADLYGVTFNNLMAWNGLNESSILYPDEKLILQVTPPARSTLTPTPAPATSTSLPPTQTATLEPSRAAALASATQTAFLPAASSSAKSQVDPFWLIWIGLAASGVVLVALFSRRKK